MKMPIRPSFAAPAASTVRRLIYTTIAIEAFNSKLRRAVKIRGHFPNEDAAIKLIYLVLRDATAEWKTSAWEWSAAKSQFAILFEERFIIR
jgi:putative transposase